MQTTRIEFATRRTLCVSRSGHRQLDERSRGESKHPLRRCFIEGSVALLLGEFGSQSLLCSFFNENLVTCDRVVSCCAQSIGNVE